MADVKDVQAAVMTGGGGGLQVRALGLPRLEHAAPATTQAESDNAEVRHLRNALVEAFSLIDTLADKARQLAEAHDEMRKRLAYYKSENMSS